MPTLRQPLQFADAFRDVFFEVCDQFVVFLAEPDILLDMRVGKAEPLRFVGDYIQTENRLVAMFGERKGKILFFLGLAVFQFQGKCLPAIDVFLDGPGSGVVLYTAIPVVSHW